MPGLLSATDCSLTADLQGILAKFLLARLLHNCVKQQEQNKAHIFMLVGMRLDLSDCPDPNLHGPQAEAC